MLNKYPNLKKNLAETLQAAGLAFLAYIALVMMGGPERMHKWKVDLEDCRKAGHSIMACLKADTAKKVDTTTSTYELVIKGKRCKESSSQLLECEYKIGNGLHIAIAGIGQHDAGVTFMKSDFDGDFYAGMGILHGCVIVKRGINNWSPNVAIDESGSMFDFAFISPRNGKIYKKWQECQHGM